MNSSKIAIRKKMDDQLRSILKKRTEEQKAKLLQINDPQEQLKAFEAYVERKQRDEQNIKQKHQMSAEEEGDSRKEQHDLLIAKLKEQFNLPDPEKDALKKKKEKEKLQLQKEEAERLKKEAQELKNANFVPTPQINVDEERAKERKEKRRQMRESQSREDVISASLKRTLTNYKLLKATTIN